MSQEEIDPYDDSDEVLGWLEDTDEKPRVKPALTPGVKPYNKRPGDL